MLFVIVLGVFYVNTENFHPFMPFGFGGASLFGNDLANGGSGTPVGVIAGASIAFFSYIGFDAVSTQGEECARPSRDLPLAIFGSLFISTALYCMVSVVLVGMVPYSLMDIKVGAGAHTHTCRGACPHKSAMASAHRRPSPARSAAPVCRGPSSSSRLVH